MFPYIAPGYYSYSFNQSQPLNDFLPQEIRAFIQQACPTLLLAGSLARAYAHYYLGLKDSPPTLAESQHFHFIICHDPRISNHLERSHLLPLRAEELSKEIFALFDKNTGTIIRDEFYMQIQKGRIGKHSLHITFLFDGLKSFFSDFEHNNSFLVDIHRNLILIERNTIYLPGFVNIKADKILPVMQLGPRPMAVQVPVLEPLPQPQPQSEPKNDTKPEDDEGIFLEFFKKAKAKRTQTNASPIDLESRFDLLPVDTIGTQDNAEEIRRHQALFAPPKVMVRRKTYKNITEHHETPEPVQDAQEAQQSPKTVTLRGFFSYLFPKHNYRRKTPIRFTVTPVVRIAPLPVVAKVHSSRYRFLEKQVKQMLQHISSEPTDWILENQLLLSSGSQQPKIDDPAKIIARFKKALFDLSMNFFTDEAKAKNITHEQMNHDMFMASIAWILFYNMWKYDNGDSERPLLIQLLTMVLAIAATLTTVQVLAARYVRQEFEAKMLLTCYNTQIELLVSPETPEKERIFKFAMVLLLAHELSVRGCGSLFEPDPELLPYEEFIGNFLRIATEKPATAPKLAASLFVSQGKINRVNITAGTVLCLASIHGSNLFNLMMKNQVPEINIAVMSAEKQEELMKETIASVRAIIADAEATHASQKTRGSNMKAPERINIIALMNKVFLIYSLRNTEDQSGFFAEFEKEYAPFTQFANEKINAFIAGCKDIGVAIVDTPDIHQCAHKSRLFECALSEKPTLAIETLERMTKPQDPGLSYRPY